MFLVKQIQTRTENVTNRLKIHMRTHESSKSSQRKVHHLFVFVFMIPKTLNTQTIVRTSISIDDPPMLYGCVPCTIFN